MARAGGGAGAAGARERDPRRVRAGLALDAVDEQALSLAEQAVVDEEAALLEALAEAAESGEASGE